MAEMARGSRCLALKVWGALERQVYAAAISAVGVFLGTDARAALDSAFSLNTARELRQLATGAGLGNVRVRFERRTLRYLFTARLVVVFMGATP